MTPAALHGTCDPDFERLRDLLADNLADGTEAGASLAVVRDGETVVDLWGGEARPGEPWREDTIVQVWSVTKVMAALTTLVLADRGLIDLDAPVSSYWPAFRTREVLVRHLLAHTSGMAGWSEALDVAGLLDLERSEAMLAEQEPWWQPGTASGYHMVSYGHLLDGLVRAATGVPLADQFRTLVAEPLGADFHLGVPENALPRCADLVPPETSGIDPKALPPGNFLLPTVTNPLLDVRALCNTEPWRRVSVAGANGHGNARSIARVQSAVSHGGEVDGVRLLSKETLDRIFDVQAEGPDLVLLVPVRFGIGYALPEPASAPAVPEGRVCWWTGYGGAVVVNDLDRRTTVAYAMNRMVPHYTSSPRTDGYLRTAFGCLEGAR
ncbi:MAG TPA: serine hydrolase domain-containing protein [Marmoricola sp.]|nr:serine hydrolase domain-containing protein [Marmoricola sp.]